MDAVGPLSDDGLVRLLTHEGERVEHDFFSSYAADLTADDLLRRRNHRGSHRCEGADDGLHAYQDYGPPRDNSSHAARESAARRTLVKR